VKSSNTTWFVGPRFSPLFLKEAWAFRLEDLQQGFVRVVALALCA
jgi:hypothetical protein